MTMLKKILVGVAPVVVEEDIIRTHKHYWTALTNPPDTATRWPTWDEVTTKPTVFTPDAHTHLWADLTDKPLTFAPSAHTHPITDLSGITGTPSASTYLRGDNTWATIPAGGVTDHGALTGLADDDHTQYHTDARGDARYSLLAHAHVKADITDFAHTHLWADLTDKPTTFAPSAHGHAWADLSGVPSFAARWPTWAEVTSKPTTFAPSAHTHLWADLTDKPTTFAPSAHGHAWADLSGLPSYATRWPTWTEVTGKPTTFAPSAHGHAIADVTSLQTTLDAKVALTGDQTVAGVKTFSSDLVLTDHRFIRGGVNHITLKTNDAAGVGINFKTSQDTSRGAVYATADGIGFLNAALSWAVRFDLSGEMEVGTVPWARLSGVPTTFTPEAHTHDVVAGLAVHTGVNNVANQIVRTDSNGYIQAGWINTVSGNFTGAPTRIMASNDAYLRYMTPANFRAQMKTPQIFVQSATPTGHVTGDLWIW